MMKKHVLVIAILLILTIFISFMEIYAYSPHYLPGGKNYLSTDNFVFEDDYYNTTNPFLVKPYTDYTITIPRYYFDEQWESISVEFYENSSIIATIDIEHIDMTYTNDGGNEWFYGTFRTTSSTNYMCLSFDNSSDYFTLYDVTETQLEEGVVFTGYESFIEGALIDTSAPYFQSASTVISYYDSPITVTEIQSALVAYDAIDGNVTGNISLVTDNYTANNSTLGMYEIVFEVSDESNNTSQITIEVEVVDVLKPIFSEIGVIQAVYPNTYSEQDILDMLSASDNYDGDISSSIIVEDNYYTVNASIVGTYQMEFSVTDTSGNKQYYIQEISVVDNQGPIISGITSIIIGYDTLITEEDVSSNLSCTDNYDSSGLDLVLENDDYTNNHNTLGSYTMEFSVTDSSGNITTQIVDIEVVDEMGPVVYFNSSIIQTYTDAVMALPDFTLLLQNAHEIDPFTDYYVTIKYDSYTRNANTPGTYHMKLNFKNDQGNEIEKDLEIRVIERPFDYIQIADSEPNESESLFTQYFDIIIGVSLTVFLIVSNVVWIVVLKKRS